MGFNNGYESGFSDCERENRKKWEKEAVAKYIAEHGSGGAASRAPKVFIPSDGQHLLIDDIARATVNPPERADISIGTGSAFAFERTLNPDIIGTAFTITHTEADRLAHATVEEPSGGWVTGDILACSYYFDSTVLNALTLNGVTIEAPGPFIFAVWYDGASFQPLFFSTT